MTRLRWWLREVVWALKWRVWWRFTNPLLRPWRQARSIDQTLTGLIGWMQTIEEEQNYLARKQVALKARLDGLEERQNGIPAKHVWREEPYPVGPGGT